LGFVLLAYFAKLFQLTLIVKSELSGSAGAAPFKGQMTFLSSDSDRALKGQINKLTLIKISKPS